MIVTALRVCAHSLICHVWVSYLSWSIPNILHLTLLKLYTYICNRKQGCTEGYGSQDGVSLYHSGDIDLFNTNREIFFSQNVKQSKP